MKYSSQLGNAVSAMGEQAVVGHADADVDGEEVHDGEDGEVLPGEAEEGGDGADVEEGHDDGGDPVDASLLVFAAHAQVLLDLAGDFGGAAGGGDAPSGAAWREIDTTWLAVCVCGSAAGASGSEKGW